MAIKVITGKGGVGKTTSAARLALDYSQAGYDVSLLSVDPLHSFGDAFGLINRREGDLVPDNKWVSVYGYPQWKGAGKGAGKLMIKKIVPRGHDLMSIRGAVERGLYTEYESLAGKEIKDYLKKDDDKSLLLIDTDSLEGLQKLLNYSSEYELLGKETEIIPVVTPEQVVLAKTNKMLSEPLLRDYTINNLIINHVKDQLEAKELGLMMEEARHNPWLPDNELVSNLAGLNQIIFYEQPSEPIGTDLMNLTVQQELITTKAMALNSKTIPQMKHYMIVGKGGQGKSTTACALAVALAEQGNKVYLMSADARSSLKDVLNTEIEYIPDEVINYPADLWESLSGEYKELDIKVLREDKYFDHVPGLAFTRCMNQLMRIDDGIVIIDAPPSGNVVKAFDNSLKYDDTLKELFYKTDMALLKRKGKKDNGARNTYDYMTARREAFTKAQELMNSQDFKVIPVTQATTTALNETMHLEGILYSYKLNPYNVFKDEKKNIVINKYDNDPTGMIDIYYPEEDYDISIIPKMSEEPIGRKALSRIGKLLIK
ncbi:MAG: ArsA-related P-loop ATPase [Candidatus Nanoarchaeia archaeon]|jgi:anion-transporting  ArsA/GET3 family ATPase